MCVCGTLSSCTEECCIGNVDVERGSVARSVGNNRLSDFHSLLERGKME